MLARGEFELDADVESDTRSLWPAVDALLDARRARALRCLRDATRGGVASVLNELARASGVAMSCARATSRCSRRWPGAAEILGIDPMYVANEGEARRLRRARGGGRRAGRAARGAGLRARASRSAR